MVVATRLTKYKFQNPTLDGMNTLGGNFPLFYNGVKDEKRTKWKKKAKIHIRILMFFYSIYLGILQPHTKFEDPGSNIS